MMAIEEAEEYLQTWSQGNGDTPNTAAELFPEDVLAEIINR